MKSKTSDEFLANQKPVALSIKQPWAALLVAGLKTIEIRTWRTSRRGRVLIHASKQPDDNHYPWQWITTPELKSLASLRGGIIGQGELVACRHYQTEDSFAADALAHRNDPSWYVEPGLFGLVFTNLRLVPFVPYRGYFFFFPVEGFQES